MYWRTLIHSVGNFTVDLKNVHRNTSQSRILLKVADDSDIVYWWNVHMHHMIYEDYFRSGLQVDAQDLDIWLGLRRRGAPTLQRRSDDLQDKIDQLVTHLNIANAPYDVSNGSILLTLLTDLVQRLLLAYTHTLTPSKVRHKTPINPPLPHHRSYPQQPYAPPRPHYDNDFDCHLPNNAYENEHNHSDYSYNHDPAPDTVNPIEPQWMKQLNRDLYLLRMEREQAPSSRTPSYHWSDSIDDADDNTWCTRSDGQIAAEYFGGYDDDDDPSSHYYLPSLPSIHHHSNHHEPTISHPTPTIHVTPRPASLNAHNTLPTPSAPHSRTPTLIPPCRQHTQLTITTPSMTATTRTITKFQFLALQRTPRRETSAHRPLGRVKLTKTQRERTVRPPNIDNQHTYIYTNTINTNLTYYTTSSNMINTTTTTNIITNTHTNNSQSNTHTATTTQTNTHHTTSVMHTNAQQSNQKSNAHAIKIYTHDNTNNTTSPDTRTHAKLTTRTTILLVTTTFFPMCFILFYFLCTSFTGTWRGGIYKDNWQENTIEKRPTEMTHIHAIWSGRDITYIPHTYTHPQHVHKHLPNVNSNCIFMLFLDFNQQYKKTPRYQTHTPPHTTLHQYVTHKHLSTVNSLFLVPYLLLCLLLLYFLFYPP